MIGLIVLLISLVNVNSVSADLNVPIKSPILYKVLKDTGFEATSIDYNLKATAEDEYEIQVCTKAGVDKNTKIKGKSLDTYPIAISDKVGLKSEKAHDLKKNACVKTKEKVKAGDKLKIGYESVEIEFYEANAQFIITPDPTECSYLYCETEVMFRNMASESLTINVSELDLQIQSNAISTQLYAMQPTLISTPSEVCDWNDDRTESNCTTIDTSYEDIAFVPFGLIPEATIPVGGEAHLKLIAVMPDEDTTFKYNASFNFLGTPYFIDPYFITTNTTFNDNATFSGTALDSEGFVGLTSSSGYYIQTFGNGTIIHWNNLTINRTPTQQLPANKAVETKFYRYNANMIGNVLLLHMNETSGNVLDYSGEDNDGTLTLTQGYGIDAVVDKGMSFDGVNDYFQILDDNSLDMTQDITIEAWIYPTSNLPVWDCIISKGGSGTTSNYYISLTNNDIVFGFYNGGWKDALGSNTNIPLNEWTHILVSFSNSLNNVRFYKNGLFVQQVARTANPLTNTQNLYIGQNGQNELFNGYIDEVAMYDRRLTDTEVLDHYRRMVSKFNLSYRSCDDASCVGESWVYSKTYPYTNLTSPNNPYFQYRAEFSTFNPTYTAELWEAIVGYEAVGCNEDWFLVNPHCSINDTGVVEYQDANNCGTYDELPAQNGTIQACNYCIEDLNIDYTSECYIFNGAGQRDYVFIDNNYYSCCALTGLVSDCSVDYPPYLGNFTESCVYTQQDFEIEADLEAFFGFGFGGLASDKVTGKIYINDSNNTYYCVSYVKTAEGNIVQTNPPYTKRTESTISIIPKEIEDREFFITKNGLANVYWTDHNLIKDLRQYIFGVECSSESNHLVSEIIMTAGYKSVNEPITRWVWVKENMFGLITGILAFIIIGLLIFFIFRVVTR